MKPYPSYSSLNFVNNCFTVLFLAHASIRLFAPLKSRIGGQLRLSPRLGNLMLKNIVLLDVNYLIRVSNLSGAFHTFHKSISQAKSLVANVLAVIFSPFDINFPTLILLQVGGTKITNQILRLNNRDWLTLT